MWITSRNNFTPLNVPSINYAPDMYNRDSFWSLMGVYDKDASEKYLTLGRQHRMHEELSVLLLLLVWEVGK